MVLGRETVPEGFAERSSREALRRHRTKAVLSEVAEERERQHEKWGEQNWPDGTSELVWGPVANELRAGNDERLVIGGTHWLGILGEEMAEAFAEEGGSALLRAELVQVAAVAVAWIEAIDRRGA